MKEVADVSPLRDRFLGPEQGLRFGNVHINPLLFPASGGNNDPLLQVGKLRLKGCKKQVSDPRTGTLATTMPP